MANRPTSPSGLHHEPAQRALARAFDAARAVDYAPDRPEAAELKRAEAIWEEIKNAS